VTDRTPANLLLTGPPKTGKTTVVTRLIEVLRARRIPAMGLVTKELRSSQGRRVGFVVQTLTGDEAVFAHEGFHTGVRVGRYAVDVSAFERVALPVMERLLISEAIGIIDEIARMELASPRFVELLGPIFERPFPLVATIHVHAHPVTDAILRRSDVEVIRVTEANRDELPQLLADGLTTS
jgi:nucleoside-triphosphatase